MECSDINRLKYEINKLVSKKQYNKARGILESMVANMPEKSALYLMLGDVAQHIDKADAIYYYQKALDLDPQNAYLNINLGFLYFNDKDFIRAEKYLQKTWIEDPTNIRLLTALGKIYKAWKQFEKAAKYFSLSELLAPNNSFVIYGLADTYRGMGNNTMALEYWLKFHNLEPKNKVALTRIGDCYLKLSNNKKALEFYQKALEIGYDFFAYIGSAKVYFSDKKFDKALHIYELIADREQRNSRYFFEFINFCLGAGKNDRASNLYKKASLLFPGNSYIESFNSYFAE